MWIAWKLNNPAPQIFYPRRNGLSDGVDQLNAVRIDATQLKRNCAQILAEAAPPPNTTKASEGAG